MKHPACLREKLHGHSLPCSSAKAGDPDNRAAMQSRIDLGQKEGKDLPVFVTALLERAAFRELHLTGQTPRQTDPTGTAAANVSAITQELLARLASLQKAAA